MFGETTDAGRLAWQRRAAACLGELLKLAAKEHLPPVPWTVHARSALVADFPDTPESARRDHLEAWKAAITAASGRVPDYEGEHDSGAGRTRLVTQWNYLPVKIVPADGPAPGVDVTLTAGIWDDDEDSSKEETGDA